MPTNQRLEKVPAPFSRRKLARSLKSLANQGIPDFVIDDLVKHVREVYGFVSSTPMGTDARDKARKELEEARKTKAIAWIGIRSEETSWDYKKGLGKFYREGVIGELRSSQRIGRVKKRLKEPIKVPSREYKSKAGMTNLLIKLQVGVDVGQEALEKVFEEADKKRQGMIDERLINIVKNLIPSDHVDKETERSVREALIFTDRSVKLSYRAQLGVGAKMTVEKYVSKKNRRVKKG